MTLLNPVELSPEAAAQFGTIVNNTPTMSEEQSQWEVKAEELGKPIAAKIRLTPSQAIRLGRIAKDSNLTIDELITQTIQKLVETNIGHPTIGAPSFARGKKVTGYSGSVSRG